MVRSKLKIEHKNVGHFLAFNNRFFEKHQRRLLRLLNYPITKRWFRWILRIRKDDIGYSREIVRILPNAYHAKGDKPGEFIADFRTHPKYGKRLYFAFFPIWWTMHFWDWLMADRFVPKLSFGFSTLTAFPSAGTGGTTGDGYVGRNLVNETLSTIRSGAGVTVDNTDVAIYAGQIQCSSTSNQFQNLWRSLLTFDTSALTSGASISAAVFSLYGDGNKSKTIAGTEPNFHVAGATPATNANFVASDYGNVQTTSFGSITYTNWNSAAYNDYNLNASGIANISKTGISKFSTQLSWDILNSFGGTWSNGSFITATAYSADETGTSKDPKLVVTYSTATNVTVSPTVQAATLSLIAVAVLLGVTIAPTVQSSALSIQTPSVKTDQVLSPNVQSATFSIQTTTFTNDTSVTVTPSVLSQSFSIQAPITRTDQNLSVNVLSATFSLQPASVNSDQVIVANAQAATFSIPSASISLGINISPSVQAATFSFQAPSVLGAALISPNTQSATFSVLSVSFGLGSVISVNVQTLLLSIPTFNVPLWSQVSRSSDATYSQVSRSSNDDWTLVNREI